MLFFPEIDSKSTKHAEQDRTLVHSAATKSPNRNFNQFCENTEEVRQYSSDYVLMNGLFADRYPAENWHYISGSRTTGNVSHQVESILVRVSVS